MMTFIDKLEESVQMVMEGEIHENAAVNNNVFSHSIMDLPLRKAWKAPFRPDLSAYILWFCIETEEQTKKVF